MIARTSLRVIPVAAVIALLSWTGPAFADDEDDGLTGPRIAFIPAAGGGIAAFTGQLPRFPSFVGLSVSQVELSYENGRWGGFGRFGYLSSGDDGRWTAPLVALGGSYRLRGDGEETWGIVARSGLLYQRWHANTAGCPVPFFFPDNCKDFVPQPLAGHVDTTVPAAVATIETVGLLAGLRAEIPVHPVFLALGAEMSTTVDVSQSSPGLVWGMQLTLAFGLRNHQAGSEPMRKPTEPARYRQRGL